MKKFKKIISLFGVMVGATAGALGGVLATQEAETKEGHSSLIKANQESSNLDQKLDQDQSGQETERGNPQAVSMEGLNNLFAKDNTNTFGDKEGSGDTSNGDVDPEAKE